MAVGARRIAGHAERIAAMFPKGSVHGPSEARREIRQDWPAFEAAARKLHTAADRLARQEGASDDGKLRDAVAAVVATCRDCHRQFRRKKNH